MRSVRPVLTRRSSRGPQEGTEAASGSSTTMPVWHIRLSQGVGRSKVGGVKRPGRFARSAITSYHENRPPHLGGRSDRKKNRPQMHADARKFNRLSACICVHLRASGVEKSCFVGHKRSCGGAEPPFSSNPVRARPLANSVVLRGPRLLLRVKFLLAELNPPWARRGKTSQCANDAMLVRVTPAA
jgi:hypothetical protein